MYRKCALLKQITTMFSLFDFIPTSVAETHEDSMRLSFVISKRRSSFALRRFGSVLG